MKDQAAELVRCHDSIAMAFPDEDGVIHVFLKPTAMKEFVQDDLRSLIDHRTHDRLVYHLLAETPVALADSHATSKTGARDGTGRPGAESPEPERPVEEDEDHGKAEDGECEAADRGDGTPVSEYPEPEPVEDST